MTDDGVRAQPQVLAVDISDSLAVHRELERLAERYPAFRFRTQAGWDRRQFRWVAERIQGADPGLHTIVTIELTELRLALRTDSATGQD